MKLLLLLFLVGCAAANIYEALEEEAETIYHDFVVGLEDTVSLKEAFGFDLIQQAEDDIKTEMGKRLRETLNEILEKIRDSVDKGKLVGKDLQDKLKEIREKMKDMKVDLGNKAKELMKKLRDRITDFWKDLFGGGDEKRSIDDEELADFNFKDLFRKLKESILSKIDKEKLKEKVEQLFGKGSEMADSLLKVINEKGDKYKQKLLDLVDRYLGKKEEKRSIKEMWEKVKDYFKNLGFELKEKYAKFGEWVKETMDKSKLKFQDKIANVKEIAREFIDHTKGVSKEVAVEALEFLKPYKEDLGALWDQVKVTVKDIVQKKE